jgi:hypothetical protein
MEGKTLQMMTNSFEIKICPLIVENENRFRSCG